MLQCIICNRNQEMCWPKRWQCFQTNGKFSESMCKLLGLPKYPYKADFQNSVYCSACQQRVYNVYLIVRKWDRLLDDISKIKLQLEKDFHYSLQTAETSIKNSENLKIGTEPKVEANAFRKRILKRLSKEHQPDRGDCKESCCYPKAKKLSSSLEPQKNGNISDYSSSDSNSSSEDDNDENRTGKCFCNTCYPQNLKAELCSNDYCADCTICNHEANAVEVPSANVAATSDKEKQPVKTTDNSSHKKKPIMDAQKPVDFDPPVILKREENIISQTDVQPTTCENENLPKSANYDKDGLKTECDDHAKNKTRWRCYRANCTRTFPTNQDLEIHIKRHHEGIKCPYVCHCGKMFQWRRELEAHSLKHSGEFAISCQLCGRGFRTTHLYNIHVKSAHSGERKYKCNWCNKSFITESKLKTHITIHTKIYPFVCQICGKGFSAKTFLTFHMTKHMEESPYQCSKCGKGFSSPRNLTQHIHSQHQSVKCNVCNTEFSTEALLKIHMSIHNESFNCTTCNKKFRFASSLKKHQKVHDRMKDSVWGVRSQMFKDNYNIQNHIQQHHGGTISTDNDKKNSIMQPDCHTKPVTNQKIPSDTSLHQLDSGFFPITDDFEISDICGHEIEQTHMNTEDFFAARDLSELVSESLGLSNNQIQAQETVQENESSSSDPVAFTINSMEPTTSSYLDLDQLKSDSVFMN